ncbi:MAG: hypothetical protein M1358_24045 [Chloroflexi bacterium]|nr:hypothetical protein [Chloroflexota bacterium]
MPSVMLAANMDEIGLEVTRIEENGFLRFAKVGFPQESLLPARKVVVGKAAGVIGVKEFHVQTEEELKTVKSVSDLFINVGAQSLVEVKGMGIKVGTRITFQGEYAELGIGGTEGSRR